MTPLEQANALLKASEKKLCAPGDDQEPHFFLRFNDPDQRELYFVDEAEARAAWNSYCGPSGHWNGYLFGVVSREPTTSLASALLEKQKALEEALGLIEAHFKTLWEDDLTVANDCGWTHAYCGRCEEDGGSELGKAATWKDVPHSDNCVYAPARAFLARQGETA